MRHGCGMVGGCVPDRLLDVCVNFHAGTGGGTGTDERRGYADGWVGMFEAI